jgi:D-aminopeptidase
MHYISGDIEGLSGFGREGVPHETVLREHLLAAVRGMRDAGETCVRLRTWHGRPELPDDVEVVRGNRAEDFDLPGLTDDFAGLALVGFHGTSPGHAFGHAYRFEHMVLNGERIGEVTVQALLAATRGVPTVLLAGARGAIDELSHIAPGAIVVVTREGKTGDEGGISAAVLDQIRSAAADAVRRAGEFPLPTPPARFHFEVPMREIRAAEIAEALDGFDVTRSRQTVGIDATDFRDVYRFLLRCFDCCDAARNESETTQESRE